MVIREWRGRTSRTKAVEYPSHFRTVVVPGLRGVRGFLGAFLSQRQQGDQIEFLVLTQWISMDAITTFAGKDANDAVVEPGAIAALTDYDQTVRHYDVLEAISAG